jgi:hypothetical protein
VSATFVATNVCALDSWASAAGLSTDEDARIRRIAAACREVGADVIQVNELVTYQNAEVFSRAMGWGGQRSQVVNDRLVVKKGDSCLLRGSGHVGVAQGFIWNPDVLQPYWAKEIDTYPGWNRNRYAVALRGLLEGKRVGIASVHLEFFPKGTNNRPFYDGIRYKQIDGLLDDVQSPGQSWAVLGDENHAPSDKPDAPGDAAKAHGLVNVDAGNIIRAQMTPDIRHGRPRMVKLGTATDHPMLVIPDVVVPV